MTYLVDEEKLKRVEWPTLDKVVRSEWADPMHVIRLAIEKMIPGYQVGFWIEDHMPQKKEVGWIPLSQDILREDWNKHVPGRLQMNDKYGALAYKAKIVCIRPIELGKQETELRNKKTDDYYQAHVGKGTKKTETPAEGDSTIYEEVSVVKAEVAKRGPGRPPKEQ